MARVWGEVSSSRHQRPAEAAPSIVAAIPAILRALPIIVEQFQATKGIEAEGLVTGVADGVMAMVMATPGIVARVAVVTHDIASMLIRRVIR